MGSAKTTGALHAARRFVRLKKNVKLVRPLVSVRSHEKPGLLVTKNGESFPSIDVESAGEITDKVQDADVVWIDEPFLFDDETALFDIIQGLRKTKEILVSALGSDCYLQPFKRTMPRLLAVADDIVYCKADCDCCGAMGKATRTLICIDDIPPGQVHVGGMETYAATCPKCWTWLMSFPGGERKTRMETYQPSV